MKIFTMIATLGLTFLAFTSFAKGAPPATPIDGGLSILLAAGGLYGVKKLRDYRKQEDSSQD